MFTLFYVFRCQEGTCDTPPTVLDAVLANLYSQLAYMGHGPADIAHLRPSHIAFIAGPCVHSYS